MGFNGKVVCYEGLVLKGFLLIQRVSKSKFLCRCLNCNEEYTLTVYNLKTRKYEYCKCNKDRNSSNIEGMRFGKLVVLRRANNIVYSSKIEKTAWVCQCDCGRQKIIARSSLISGLTSSCGCIKHEHMTEKEYQEYQNTTCNRTCVKGYKTWTNTIKSKGKCEICDNTNLKQLRAHHIIEWSYLRFRPNIRFRTGMGICICEKCHKDYHSIAGIKDLSHPGFLAYQALRNTMPNFLNLPKQERRQLMEELEKYITDLFERLQSLEDERKALADEIKESIKVFAENYELEAEAVAEGYKKYKKYLKDPDKFILVDYSIDKVLHSFVKEYQEDKVKQNVVEEQD